MFPAPSPLYLNPLSPQVGRAVLASQDALEAAEKAAEAVREVRTVEASLKVRTSALERIREQIRFTHDGFSDEERLWVLDEIEQIVDQALDTA